MRVQGLVLSLALAAAVPVVAQNYERLDRNGDGQITRREWRGSMQEFRNRDWNHDGVLSGDEIYGSSNSDDNDGMRRRTREEGMRNRTRSDAGNGSAINSLDKNRDGRVEGYEWPYNARMFHQLDTNRDSVLTADELRNMDQATLRDLDKNGNGRIDSDEWPGGFAQFDRLDQNNDGRVSADEYMQRGGEWQRRRRFDIWDTNQDSRISMNEWKSSAALFRRLDTNHDGFVDWNEYQANTDRYDRPYGWR